MTGDDETLDDRGYVMPYPPVPAVRVLTPLTSSVREERAARRDGIPLAIGTGIVALVTTAGAVVGVIWALNW